MYVALWDFKTPHRPTSESASWCLGNLSSLMTPSPGWVSFPNFFVSLFIFYILSYLLLKTISYLSGCLVSSASIQKLFCGIFSVFKWSFNKFVGEKVVSLSYSSTIIGLPPLSHFTDKETKTRRCSVTCLRYDCIERSRKGRGTRDQIANICWIIEAREYQ